MSKLGAEGRVSTWRSAGANGDDASCADSPAPGALGAVWASTSASAGRSAAGAVVAAVAAAVAAAAVAAAAIAAAAVPAAAGPAGAAVAAGAPGRVAEARPR